MNTRTNDDDHLVPRLTVAVFNEIWIKCFVSFMLLPVSFLMWTQIASIQVNFSGTKNCKFWSRNGHCEKVGKYLIEAFYDFQHNFESFITLI